MKQFRQLAAVLCMAFLITGFSGCKSSTLEQGGVYSPGVTASVTNADSSISQIFTPSQRPDLELFISDSAFGIAYSAIDVVFNLERNNRAALWKLSPQIKTSLDQIRPQAADAVRKYTSARKAYIANPTPAGLSGLQTILSEAQRLATSVQSVVPVSTVK